MTPSETIAGNAPSAAGHRRPDDPGERDRDRGHGRQPDDEVERAARPVGEQDEAGRDRPARDERDSDEPELEPADPHTDESIGSPPEPAGATGRKYRVGWDRRVIAAIRARP